MTLAALVLSVVAGLVANELFDLCPWLTRPIMRQAARLRYGKTERAATRAEEWESLVDFPHGRLFKLLMALGFLIFGVASLVARISLRIVGLALVVSSAAAVYRGGLQYVTSGGDQDKITVAKERILRPIGLMVRWSVFTGLTHEDEILAKMAATVDELAAIVPSEMWGRAGTNYASDSSVPKNEQHRIRESLRLGLAVASTLFDLTVVVLGLGLALLVDKKPGRRMVMAFIRMVSRDSSFWN